MKITERKLRRIIREEIKRTRLGEATVKLDTMNPDDRKLRRFVQGRDISMKNLGQVNPGIDFIEYEGDRADLENMIDKFWMQDSLKDFIED